MDINELKEHRNRVAAEEKELWEKYQAAENSNEIAEIKKRHEKELSEASAKYSNLRDSWNHKYRVLAALNELISDTQPATTEPTQQ